MEKIFFEEKQKEREREKERGGGETIEGIKRNGCILRKKYFNRILGSKERNVLNSKRTRCAKTTLSHVDDNLRVISDRIHVHASCFAQPALSLNVRWSKANNETIPALSFDPSSYTLVIVSIEARTKYKYETQITRNKYETYHQRKSYSLLFDLIRVTYVFHFSCYLCLIFTLIFRV